MESKEKDREAYQTDWEKAVWKWKKDWYELDFLYLEQNPQFEAWNIYKSAAGFSNKYLEFFAEDAFANRQEYITDFYGEKRNDIHREYPYLDKQRMSEFVAQAVELNLKNIV